MAGINDWVDPRAKDLFGLLPPIQSQPVAPPVQPPGQSALQADYHYTPPVPVEQFRAGIGAPDTPVPPPAALADPILPPALPAQPPVAPPTTAPQPAQEPESAQADDAATMPPQPMARRQGETAEQFAQRAVISEQSDLESAWDAGWLGTKQLYAGAAAALGDAAQGTAIGDALGAGELHDWGVDKYQALEKEMEPYQEGRVSKLEQIEDAGDLGRFALWSVGQMAPSVVESIGTGLIGAAIGAGAPGAVAGFAGKTGIKSLLKDKVAAYAAKEMAEKKVSKEVAEQAAMRALAPSIGAGTAMFANSYVMGTGDIYGETMDEGGKGNAGVAALFALPYAALDAVTDLSVFGSILKGSGGDKALSRYAKAMLTTGAKEAGAEAGQEATLMLAGTQAGKEYTQAEVMSRLGNSAAAAFIGGGVLGAAGGRKGAQTDAERDEATLGAVASVGLTSAPNSDVLQGVLANANADPERRTEAAAQVEDSMRAGGLEDMADVWNKMVGKAIEAGESIRPTSPVAIAETTAERAVAAKEAALKKGHTEQEAEAVKQAIMASGSKAVADQADVQARINAGAQAPQAPATPAGAQAPTAPTAPAIALNADLPTLDGLSSDYIDAIRQEDSDAKGVMTERAKALADQGLGVRSISEQLQLGRNEVNALLATDKEVARHRNSPEQVELREQLRQQALLQQQNQATPTGAGQTAPVQAPDGGVAPLETAPQQPTEPASRSAKPTEEDGPYRLAGLQPDYVDMVRGLAQDTGVGRRVQALAGRNMPREEIAVEENLTLDEVNVILATQQEVDKNKEDGISGQPTLPTGMAAPIEPPPAQGGNATLDTVGLPAADQGINDEGQPTGERLEYPQPTQGAIDAGQGVTAPAQAAPQAGATTKDTAAPQDTAPTVAGGTQATITQETPTTPEAAEARLKEINSIQRQIRGIDSQKGRASAKVSSIAKLLHGDDVTVEHQFGGKSPGWKVKRNGKVVTDLGRNYKTVVARLLDDGALTGPFADKGHVQAVAGRQAEKTPETVQQPPVAPLTKADEDAVVDALTGDTEKKPETKPEEPRATPEAKPEPNTAESNARTDADKTANADMAEGSEPAPDVRAGVRAEVSGEAPGGGLTEKPPVSPPAEQVERGGSANAAYGAGNTYITKDRAAELQERLKAKLRQISANPVFDPELYAIGAELAAFHIEAGARAFSQFASNLLDDLGPELGDKAKPYLKSWYNGARDFPGFDNNGMTPATEVDAALAAFEAGRQEQAGKKSETTTNLKAEGDTNEQTRRAQDGETDQGGQPPTDGDGGSDGRVDRGGDDSSVAGGATKDGGKPDSSGDTQGVRARAGAQTGAGAQRQQKGGDGLAGQQGGGKQGLADNRDAGDRPTGATSEHVEDLEARSGLFHAQDPEAIYGGTPKVRFKKNQRAIELYRELEETGRYPTAEEQNELAGYTGWGSFGQELFKGTWDRAIYTKGWKAENDWLRTHLGKDEWNSAHDSITNSHYTDPPTVQAMWSVIEKMGFQGGRVLEPSAGVGNFIAMMPEKLKEASEITAIELDDLTAGILKELYPGANVQQKGYQESKTPDGFYDLVIGNWPFSPVGPADRRYNKLSPSLHDYFFLKALDQTRPGGLVAGITSRYTLDSVSHAVRQEMAKKGDLIAAWRLPTGAFGKYAGTNVVTDIIVLRRREEVNTNPQTVPWVGTQEIKFGPGEKAKINNHYVADPDSVLGELGWGSGTTYGREGVIVDRPDNYMDMLGNLADEVDAGQYEPSKNTQHIRYITNNTNERTGAITVGRDGALYQVHGDQLASLNDIAKFKLKDAAKTKDREAQLLKMVELRRGYGALIDAETAGAKNTESLRKTLKKQYKEFVAAHGPINESWGLGYAMRIGDPFAPSLAALEHRVYGKWQPMAILDRPVVRRTVDVANPSVQDAYVIARNEGLSIDMAAIAEQAGVTEEAAAKTLIDRGAVFRDPAGQYVPADVYRGGNVRRKLREAQAAADEGVDMAHNIAELEKVQPADVPYFNIEARLGAQWVSPQVYRQFVGEELIGREGVEEDVTAEWRINRWVVDVDDEALKSTPAALQWRDVTAYRERTKKNPATGELEPVLGADGQPIMDVVDSERIPFRQLVEAAFNNGTMKFTAKDADGNRYTREALSAAANEKASGIREAFEDWVWKAPERRVATEGDFNEIMNAIAPPNFDGDFLSLSGMALQRGDNPFSLRKHQSDAIWRGLVQGSGLYAHEVGTGKAQPLDAKVLTPTGWRLMGELEVGDRVIGVDGGPTAVTGVYPQGEKEIWRVVFSDGSATECCDDHLWLTQTYAERNYAQRMLTLGRDWDCAKPQVRPLSEIRATLTAPHLGAKNHSIPIVQPVCFDAQDISLDPYLMGVLLGGGGMTSGSVMIRSQDAGLVDGLSLPAGVVAKRCESAGRCPTWVLRIADGLPATKGKHPVTKALRELGLMGGGCGDKHVPATYLFNTIEVRVAVLQGLLDTDGSISKSGYSVYFYTISDRLADDVTALVWSLGGTVSRTLKKPFYRHKGEKRKGRPVHVLCLRLPPEIAPFRLARKASMVVPESSYRPARYIVSAEPVGRKPAQCIAVDHPDKLYVTDDFIVTHNTYTMGGLAVESRRLGLAQKPLILGHNANSASVAGEINEMYPGAKVLYVDNLTPKRVKQTMMQIRNDDWDAVVMPHSLLDRLTLKRETLEALAADEIAALEAAFWAEMDEDTSGSDINMSLDDDDAIKKLRNPTAKELAKARQTIKANIEKQAQSSSREDAVSFEDLGIDMVMVDEAHCFPYEAKVMTDQGVLQIGEIVEKRLNVRVLSVVEGALQYQPIRQYWKNDVGNKRFLMLCAGHSTMICTENHHLYVEGRGYVEARSIQAGESVRVLLSGVHANVSREEGIGATVLLSDVQRQGSHGAVSRHQDMPGVQEGISVSQQRRGAEQSANLLQRDLQNGGAAQGRDIHQAVETGYVEDLGRFSAEGAQVPGERRADAGQQPNAESRDTQKSQHRVKGAGVPSHQGRQRDDDGTAAITATGNGLADRIRDQDSGGEGSVRSGSESLQSGPGGSMPEVGDRDRRALSQVGQGAPDGRQEGSGFALARVESVEVLERGSLAGHGRSLREDRYVYDLGVDGRHNYFADGVLVHNSFKKPPFATRMKMRGLQKQTSKRSIALKFLTDYIKRERAGRGVHLFTGTPITNTLAELFHMQRYVMSDDMARDGIDQWDSWFNTFATGVSDVEFTAAGEYRPVTRLAGFINVAELRRLMSPYMDVVFADDMPEFQPRPASSGRILSDKALTDKDLNELTNGRREGAIGRPYKKVVMDVAEMSNAQKGVLAEQQALAQEWDNENRKQRMEWMREGAPQSPIIIEGTVARVGLDERLEDLGLPDNEDSKINRAARNIMRHYTTEDRASQAVFMDKGYSDTRTRRGERIPGLNLAKELKDKLVKAGIPESEVAIVAGGVKPARKKAIADAMNAGTVRVVIGQTETLGTGVNMQRHLRAMHHIDAPWMPGELEQRNGRGWRQGNEWNTVLEYRYITERIDGKRWQVLATKDRFIKAFLKADDNVRVIEGDAAGDGEGDNYSETLSEAVGDPRLLLRNKLSMDVQKLQRKERVHSQGVAEALSEVGRLQSIAPKGAAKVKQLRADYAIYLEAAQAADDARHAQYRTDLADWVESIGEPLSQAERQAIETNGWGTAQKDRALAKRVGDAARVAIAGGNKRPEKPTTKAVQASLLRDQDIRSLDDLEAKIKTLRQRMPQGTLRSWRPVGELYGFPIEAKAGLTKEGVRLRLVSRTDPSKSYEGFDTSTASSLNRLLTELGRDAEGEVRQSKLDKEKIEKFQQVAATPFSRQATLDRKAKQLADLEADMALNPRPAPAWLRNGAPLESEVYIRSLEDATLVPEVVEGHQWSDDGYFVIVSDGDQSRAIPYMDVLDSNGQPVFEEHAFEAPVKKAASSEPAQAGAEQDASPRFQIATVSEKPAKGMPLQWLEQILGKLTGGLQGLDGWSVRAVQSEGDLPAHIAGELAARRQEAPGATVNAVMDPEAKEVIFVADAATTPEQVTRTLMHELVKGHVGLRRLLGNRFDNLLDRVAEWDKAGVERKAAEYGYDMAEPGQVRAAAEELLAELAETHKNPGMMRRVYAMIRRMLRDVGIDLNLSRSDIDYILSAAERGVRRGDTAATRREAAAVRRQMRGIEVGAGGDGGRFSFAGEKAETANKMTLDAARKLLSVGAPADAVRQETGWFKGDDDKFRFEINDSDARLLPEYQDYPGIPAPLGSVLDHPALFAAYPGLRTTRVLINIEPGSKTSGSYSSGTESITVTAPDETEALSALMHEIQHGIQTIEGFAEGGNTRMFQDSGTADLQNAMQAEFDRGKAKEWADKADEALAAGKYDVALRANEKALMYAEFQAYQSLGGEVEARNVQERLNMTAEERQDFGPDTTRDTPAENTILVWNGDVMQSAPPPENTVGGATDPGNARFSLRSTAPLNARESGLMTSVKDAMGNAKERFGDKWRDKLTTTLGALTLRQLSEVGAKILPGISPYAAEERRMDRRRNEMVDESGKLADNEWQVWAAKKENRAEAEDLAEYMHDTTRAQVDPDNYEPIKIQVKLGPDVDAVELEATPENVAMLQKRKREANRYGQPLEVRQTASFIAEALSDLRRAAAVEAERQSKLADLQSRWDALPAQAQDIYRKARDMYSKRSGEMREALIKQVMESEAMTPEWKEATAKRIRAQFEDPLDESGNPRIGPYFPLQRFGQLYTYARKYPTGSQRTFKKLNGDAFSSEASAWSAAHNRADLKSVDAVPVEADGGWVLKEKGEKGFWMFESARERKAGVAGLERDGWTVIKQGRTDNAREEIEQVSEGFMAEAVKRLKEKGADDEADMLYQMYLDTLHENSIRKHFMHRKGTTGYSKDALRSFGWNMSRLAHQIAKLEHIPVMERMLVDMRKHLDDEDAYDPKTEDRTTAQSYLQELEKRHKWIIAPDNAAWTTFSSALGFVWYLGVTPGAALVNMTQTPIVALPAMAGKFNDWSGSAKALGSAFGDVRRGFNGKVMKGFLTGKPVPGEAANLSAQEKAAFKYWDTTGARDRTQAHNLAGIGEQDTFYNGPTFNRVMAFTSSLFHAAEVVNRDVTLLASYRMSQEQLAPKVASGDMTAKEAHQESMRVAEDLTWDSHFNYSNANRARFMQGNVAKSLLMFRSYSQHMSYFLWRNLYQWTKGESPEVRREARTKLLGILGMTGLFAGALGMPMIGGVFMAANLAAAAFGDDDEPYDAEIEFRNWLRSWMPGDVADVLERGVANKVTGLDWQSRVSLNELWFRSPDRDLDGAGTYQHIVEQLMGPLGGIASAPFTGMDHMINGDWDRAAESMSPKFLRDALRAGRYANEGVQTRRGDPVVPAEDLNTWELVWKAMGMNPDEVGVRYDANNAVKKYERRILDRRSRLMTAYAMASIERDRDAMQNVMGKIRAFNKAQPTIPIRSSSIRASVRNRLRYSEEAEHGVLLNKRLRHLNEVGGFAQ